VLTVKGTLAGAGWVYWNRWFQYGKVVPRHGKAKTAVAEAIKAWHRRKQWGKKKNWIDITTAQPCGCILLKNEGMRMNLGKKTKKNMFCHCKVRSCFWNVERTQMHWKVHWNHCRKLKTDKFLHGTRGYSLSLHGFTNIDLAGSIYYWKFIGGYLV